MPHRDLRKQSAIRISSAGRLFPRERSEDAEKSADPEILRLHQHLPE